MLLFSQFLVNTAIRDSDTAGLTITYRVFFFYCSALKMLKCQPLKEISELFLPKNNERRKLKYPNCYYCTVGTVEIL